MERRWNQRKSANFDVVITHGGHTVVSCKGRDISIEGMCIGSGPLSYPLGTALQLEFSLGNGTEPVQVTGLVTHAAPQCMGLTFFHDDVRLVRLVKEYMDSRAESRAA